MKKSIFTLLLFFASYFVLSAQNWKPLAAGLLPNNYNVYGISAIGDKVVWAVASDGSLQGPIPTTHFPYILRSSDGGEHWTVKAIEEAAGTISFQLVAVDSLTAWITTQDYNGGAGRKLYQTTDGGEVWTSKLNNIAAGVALNRFSDGQHWLAQNRQSISRSDNNGLNWQNSTITGYQTDEYQILYSGTNMSCTAGDTSWNGTSAGRIVRFTGYGEASEFINTGLGTTATITSVAFQDHLNGLLFYANNVGNAGICRSTDGGSTWSILPQQPGIFARNISAIPGAPGSYVVASVSATPNGKISTTKDFGETWTTETLAKPLNAITFSSPTSGWAGIGKITSAVTPAIFKYIGAPLVGTDAPESGLPGFVVAPNPVEDMLRFQLDGNSDDTSYSATVSDASGRVIIQAQIFDKQLDVSRLSSGIYMLKIECGQGFATQKFVKR